MERWLGREDVGVIAEGKRADTAVLDPEVIADRATFAHPHRYGVELLGQILWQICHQESPKALFRPVGGTIQRHW